MINEEFQKLVLQKLSKLDKIESDVTEIKSEVFKISTSQQEDIKAMLKIIDDKTSDIKDELQGVTDVIGEHSVDIAVLKRKTKSFKIAE